MKPRKDPAGSGAITVASYACLWLLGICTSKCKHLEKLPLSFWMQEKSSQRASAVPKLHNFDLLVLQKKTEY
jgi:hypothetical protein